MSELPKAWVEVEIDELLAPLEDGRALHQGWSPQCENYARGSEDEWGVLKTTAIQPGRFVPEYNKGLPRHLEPRPLIEVRRGDILITCAGPRSRCGIACLVTSDQRRLMLSGKMYRFRVSESQVNPRFIAEYLQSPRAQLDIDDMKTGGSDSGLNLTHSRFRRLRVPLAPRPEQDRIVAAIEEQVSRLDHAVANLESALRRLPVLRRRVLATSVETGEQHALGDLLEDIVAGRSFKTDGRRATPSEWGVIKVSAMTWGHFIEDENKAVPTTAAIDIRFEIRAGDVLLSRANTSEYVGATVYVERCRSNLLLSDKSMRLVPRSGIERKWLAQALNAPSVREQMSLVATGTSDSMRNISQEKVRRLELRVPPLKEQLRIVDEIEQQLSRIEAVRAASAHALIRSDHLRRAILERAFSGQLVSQDPNDEAATGLSARIPAQGTTATRPRRRMRG